MRLSLVGSTGWSGSTYASRLAVAVGVEDQRRPALRRHLVAGLVEHLRVEPADDLAAAARPQRAVRVFGEHQMVRAEARADVRELLRLRVVHLQMPARVVRPGTPSPTDGSIPPCRQSGFSGGRTADVSHRRPFSSSIGLCTLFLLVQITSSPQYGDGCGIVGLVGGVFGSRTDERNPARPCASPDRAPAGSRSSARASRRSGRSD